MSAEDKVSELFCIANDFRKIFDVSMQMRHKKRTLRSPYYRVSTLSKAEIMVVIMLSHGLGYRCRHRIRVILKLDGTSSLYFQSW